MSEPNPFISNGTCYTARGEKLDGSFIPCGNDAFGHQTCCGAGDNCLADNACFGVHGSGYGSYLTYWAGCTDENYEDATCPKKEIDQPWVALTRCDDHNDQWAICSQEGDPSTLQPGAYCSCTVAASATVAFTDSNTLTSICSLPRSTGQSIQFFGAHVPSSSLTSGSNAPSRTSGSPSTSGGDRSSGAASNSADTTTSGPASTKASSAAATSGPTSSKATSAKASSGSVTVLTTSVTVLTSSGRTFTSSTALPLTTSTTTEADPSSGNNTHSGLSSGAKAGIGVGAGLGALVLLGIIVAVFLVRRRRRRPPQQPEADSGAGYESYSRYSKPHPSSEPPKSTLSTEPPLYDKDGQVIQEADSRAARPWTVRNELEGTQVMRKGEPGPIAELEG